MASCSEESVSKEETSRGCPGRSTNPISLACVGMAANEFYCFFDGKKSKFLRYTTRGNHEYPC
jgi:hypothetical protein